MMMILMREMILTLMKNKLMRKINLMIKIVSSYKIAADNIFPNSLAALLTTT